MKATNNYQRWKLSVWDVPCNWKCKTDLRYIKTQFLVYISLPNPLPNWTLISLLKTYFVIPYRTQKIPDPHFQKQIVNETQNDIIPLTQLLIDWVFFNAPTSRQSPLSRIVRSTDALHFQEMVFTQTYNSWIPFFR